MERKKFRQSVSVISDFSVALDVIAIESLSALRQNKATRETTGGVKRSIPDVGERDEKFQSTLD